MGKLESIDILIVGVYLILCLLIGLYKTTKIKNIRDYAIGNKEFSIMVIISTIYATHVSANQVIAKVEQIYNVGMVFAGALFFMPVAWILVKNIFAKNIGNFEGCISISEIMHRLYGKSGLIVTNIITVIFSIGIVAVQVTAIGYLFNFFFNISYFMGVLIGFGILTTYSMLGGVRAVALTDVFQFLIFFVALPLVAGKAYFDAGGYYNIINRLPDSHKVITQDSSSVVTFLSFVFFATLPSVGGPYAQRLLMAKSRKQLLQSYNVLIFASVFLALILFILGFSIKVIYPNIEAKTAFYHFMLDLPPIFIGFMVAGMLAVTMSTADSWLNSLSVTIAHDIIKNSYYNITEKQELYIARFFTFFCGVLAVILALKSKEIFKLILMSQAFNYPITLIPLCAGMLSFRTNYISFLTSVFFGLASVIIVRVWSGNFSAAAIMFGTLGSAIGFFGAHYLQFPQELKKMVNNIGFSFSKKLYIFPKLATQLKKFSLVEEIDEGRMSYILIFTLLVTFLNVPAFAFGMYNIEVPNTLLYVRIISSILCILLCMREYWLNNKTIYNFLTYFTIVFCLPFTSSYCLFLSQYESAWIIYFVLSSIIFYILVPSNNFLIFYFLGVIVSYGISKYMLEVSFSYSPEVNLLDNYKIAVYYSIILMCFLIYVLYDKYLQTLQKIVHSRKETSILDKKINYLNKRVRSLADKNKLLDNEVEDYELKSKIQEQEIRRLSETAQRIINNVNHELRLPVGNVVNFAEMLGEGLEKFTKEQLQEISSEVVKNSNRLSSMILNMLDLAMLEVGKMNLSKKNINFSKMVKERVQRCFKMYRDKRKNITFKLDIQKEIFLEVDPNYMQQVIDNLVNNSLEYTSQGIIDIKLNKRKNLVIFEIKDEGVGILPSDLHQIFEPFFVGSKTYTPAEGRGIGLTLCKKAIEAHGGTITAKSRTTAGVYFRFTLPSM